MENSSAITSNRKKRHHRHGKNNNKNKYDINNSPSGLSIKKYDQVATITADQMAEGRRMMELDKDV
jgi:hypothetical protein